MTRIVNHNVRERILKGMALCNNTVCVTAGPKGRNVAIDNGGTPTFTNDGVSVIRELFAKDPIENIGVSMIKQACERTNKLAGDGTTATAILTYAIANEGIKHINKGTNPFKLSKALQDIGQYIIQIVKSQGKELTTKEQVEQIATISAQDEEVGEIIASAMDTVGNDGTILIEQGNQQGLQLEIKTGLQFDTGFLSPYMANQGMEFIANNISVLVTDETIEHINQILPLLTLLEKAGIKDLVIICDNIETEPAVRIAQLKHSGLFNLTCIKAPGFGELKHELLQDIAVVTNATFITRELGKNIATTTLPDIGSCGHIKSNPNSTIITDGAGTKEDIAERVETIKAQQAQTTNEYEIAKHQERISKLSGGIAIIKVGAPSEMETKNKIFKIEDALNATKSAVEEGIVDGGGLALASVKLPSKGNEENLKSEYYEIAKEILSKATKYPYMNIIRNAGYDPEKVAAEQPLGMGFDSNIGLYVNMMDEGIIDPIKVIRVALENAISSATMLLTTEATITDEPNE